MKFKIKRSFRRLVLLATLVVALAVGTATAAFAAGGNNPPPLRYDLYYQTFYGTNYGATPACYAQGVWGVNNGLFDDYYCWQQNSTITQMWVDVNA